MNKPKVTIIIVTWDSMRFIFDCLESLMHQSFRDFSVIIIDNNSTDGTVEFVRTYFPNVSVLQNFNNLGYCKANNQGIKIAKSEYVLILNPDVIMNKDFLQELVKCANMHPDAGSVGGKIYKLHSEDIDPTEGGSGMITIKKSKIIDSAGLKIYKNRAVVNRGENKEDIGQFEKSEEVFGISGACVMYRKSALEEIKIKEEYFDNDFFAYKEEIDLAYRLRLYGWKSWFAPLAIAYHHRSFSKPEESKIIKVVNSRKNMSKLVRFYSFKNHHLTLIKNEFTLNFVLDFFAIIWRELKLFFYILFFEFFVIKSLPLFFKQIPGALLKRKIIFSHKKVDYKQIRKWFR